MEPAAAPVLSMLSRSFAGLRINPGVACAAYSWWAEGSPVPTAFEGNLTLSGSTARQLLVGRIGTGVADRTHERIRDLAKPAEAAIEASDDDVVLDKSGETHVGQSPGVRSSR